MEKLNESAFIEQLILIKQAECNKQGEALKQHFRETYESLKPINIIKNTFKQATSSPGLKTDLVNTTIGLASGFIAKKLFIGNSSNLITKLLGNILGSFVAVKTEKSAEGIKSVGSFLVNKIVGQDNSK